MTGYQEIITDPSYKGQIVIMTYPLIGNYGINEEDVESQAPKVEGFIIKENCTIFSNWRGDKPLSDYLIHHRVMGVDGMDTRALTKHIRTAGAMKAFLSTEDHSHERLIEKARSSQKDLWFISGEERKQHFTACQPTGPENILATGLI
jgi:carbamoyl-phosphate synthase small subunit